MILRKWGKVFMIGHHQVYAIRQLIIDLIPDCTVHHTQQSVQKCDFLSGRKLKTGTGEYAGISEEDGKFKFWIQCNTDKFDIFQIERELIAFSKGERRIIYALPATCRSLTIGDTDNTVFTQRAISSQFTMPYFIISHFMRGTNPSCLWSSIIGLVLLQKLSYRKYEGNPCSSGFLCLKSIRNTIEERINCQKIYKYEAFSKPILLTPHFFEKPLSYRYVDGKNSFYVIDNHESVLGIIRNENPNQFDIISRSTFQHISALTSIPGFRWLAYPGLHNDVIAHTKGKMTFQWD
jgi:hypothetical protein